MESPQQELGLTDAEGNLLSTTDARLPPPFPFACPFKLPLQSRILKHLDTLLEDEKTPDTLFFVDYQDFALLLRNVAVGPFAFFVILSIL